MSAEPEGQPTWLDPDPRHVDEDEVFDPAVGAWVPRPSALMALLVGMLSGAVVGLILGFLIATIAFAATSRPGPQTTERFDLSPLSSAESRTGVPRSGMPVEAAAEASRVAPTRVGEVGTPTPSPAASDAAPPATPDLDAVTRQGVIAYAGESFGARYLALPIGPGHRVTICGPGGCWTAVSTDAGPDRQRQREGRIADVAVGHWEAICGVPRRYGTCVGSWTVAP